MNIDIPSDVFASLLIGASVTLVYLVFLKGKSLIDSRKTKRKLEVAKAAIEVSDPIIFTLSGTLSDELRQLVLKSLNEGSSMDWTFAFERGWKLDENGRIEVERVKVGSYNDGLYNQVESKGQIFVAVLVKKEHEETGKAAELGV